MASNKPKTEESTKAEVKEETKVEEKKETEVNKLELAKEVLAASKEKEAEKQKGIYGLMGSFKIVRN